MTAAIIKAVPTSKTECCLINMVDNMMDTQRKSEETRIHFLFVSRLFFTMAK